MLTFVPVSSLPGAVETSRFVHPNDRARTPVITYFVPSVPMPEGGERSTRLGSESAVILRDGVPVGYVTRYGSRPEGSSDAWNAGSFGDLVPCGAPGRTREEAATRLMNRVDAALSRRSS